MSRVLGVEEKEKTPEQEEKEKATQEKKNPLIKDEPLKTTSQDRLRYMLRMDSMQSAVEANYFWISRFLQEPGAYGVGYSGKVGRVEKLKDVFAASETSAYWGAVEMRKGAQQEKASTFMATVGKMLKDTFQIIRELRIIDERVEYYDGYEKGDDASSVALKSIWVDMVEGGGKNPSSVTGLSMTGGPGFVILPDLFYKIHPKKSADVDADVAKLKGEGINRKIREVLGRKLKQFIIWKEKTEKEIRTRKNFVLKYLRQHYHVIKMYIEWLRPYLRNIKRLQMKQDFTDKDIVAAFETSKIELELLAIKNIYECEIYYGHKEEREFKKYFPCLKVKFNFVALPEMAFQQEYQRGAVHLGRTEIVIEGFVVTKDQIEEYKKKLDEEDLELLSSVNSAVDALKEELEHYLEEAGELVKKEAEEKKAAEGFLSPIASVGRGFKELFGSLFRIKRVAPAEKEKKVRVTSSEEIVEQDAAEEIAKNDAYAVYFVFKKAHGLITE